MNLYRERWTLGFVPHPIDMIIRQGTLNDVRWLPLNNQWEMFADPACIRLPDGRLVLMAEHLHYWRERGEIWAAVIENDDFSNIVLRPWLASNFHLSYPFPFYDNKTLYMICESWEAFGLYLWQYYPQRGWRLRGKIIDRPVVDATIWRGPNDWWLFCGIADDHPNQKLYVYFAQHPEGPWLPHPANPVKTDITSSRPAGPLYRYDAMTVRPTQDCSQSYGGAITFNVIESLDRENFSEYPLRQLKPNAPWDGLHTICAAGNVTIIDARQWTVQPLDAVRKMVVPFRKRWRWLQPPKWPECLPDFTG